MYRGSFSSLFREPSVQISTPDSGGVFGGAESMSWSIQWKIRGTIPPHVPVQLRPLHSVAQPFSALVLPELGCHSFTVCDFGCRVSRSCRDKWNQTGLAEISWHHEKAFLGDQCRLDPAVFSKGQSGWRASQPREKQVPSSLAFPAPVHRVLMSENLGKPFCLELFM